ncbi:unnamed protein product [Fraxinus pennsylvanica]|uniref:Uncharacterized protein n=1 Tax=Fraxinus pennsylvanica TaxID=56036 RepID=A0AAD1Z025_9LAMI|nr:unnamed protein product [Fraxinus pennsylvanica]
MVLKWPSAMDEMGPFHFFLEIVVEIKTNFKPGKVNESDAIKALVHKAFFKLLNVNENFISDEGIDELKDIFKESPENLGPMDENDPEGGDDDNNRESGDDGEGSEDELESKLKNLDANQDE